MHLHGTRSLTWTSGGLQLSGPNAQAVLLSPVAGRLACLERDGVGPGRRERPRHGRAAGVIEVPLEEIQELDDALFGADEAPTWRSFAAHCRLVQEAELRYPIIRAANGAVMDGMHRVSKALIEGRDTIEAVQFDTDPEPDHVGRRPDEL